MGGLSAVPSLQAGSVTLYGTEDFTFEIKCWTRTLRKFCYKRLLEGVSNLFFFFWHESPPVGRTSSFTRFLDHTQRRTTEGRTPLDQWSARRRDLYVTTHNTHNRHPWLRWDSNPKSQQVSGRRPRALGLASNLTRSVTSVHRVVFKWPICWFYGNWFTSHRVPQLH